MPPPDATAQTVVDLSPLALAGMVFVMLTLEGLSPLVPLLSGKARARHGLTNVGIAACAGVFAVSGSMLLTFCAAWATQARFGLLNLADTPFALRFFVALAGIDLFEWVRHRTHHAVPLLWRLHRVHHSDAHVDATTAIRGHPFESAIAYPYFALLVTLLGIDPLSLALRTLVTTLALAWHHSAFKLPAAVDRALSLVTPTPRTHRVHHSREVRFTDSNFGTVFTWWDRLFGTFTPGRELRHAPTGLEGFDSRRAQSWWGVLRSPFDAPEVPPTQTERSTPSAPAP